MPATVAAFEQKEILDSILKMTGIRLPDTLHDVVMEYLAGRAAREGIPVPVFFSRLKEGGDEFDLFVDKITIGETYFFRDENQFRVIDETLFPEFAAQGRQTLRIWSAACSTGEEAVSLALLAARHRDMSEFSDFTVYATDLNRRSLESLSRGMFKAGSLRPDGAIFHGLIEPHLSRPDPLTLSLSQTAMSNIVATRLDLSTLDYWSVPDDLDLVLLRNVLIYLDSDLREGILAALVKKLRLHGCIFLAASEVPLFMHPELVLRNSLGVFFLEKVFPRAAAPVRAGVSRSRDTISELRSIGSNREAAPTKAKIPSGEKTTANATREKSLSTEPRTSTTVVEPKGVGTPVSGDSEYGETFYRKCFELVNANALSEARSLLEGAGASVGGGAMALFLFGFSWLCDGNTERAREDFSRCLAVDPDFWPARYQRGILESQNDGERARRDFMRSRIDIERYIQRGRHELDFLLEGFNSRYFLEMCGKWIEKLSLTGDRHGNR
jgi:chemotaxis protein methyltransferase CheR